MADFFPSRDADFMGWLKNFSTVVTENAAAWVIPTETASGLAAKVMAYETVYTAATGENATKSLVVDKNGKRDALKADIRDLKNKFIDYNDAVTDPDRIKLQLPLHDKTPTPKPVPTDRPALEVVPTNNRQHTATAFNQSGKKTKPVNVHGISFSWAILDTPPANPDDLRHSVFRVKAVEVFDYKEDERGKNVYYAARYENAKGEAGPWSDIIMAIIP
ncbi:hypothetical protein ACYULU_11055 [Breznakiellaceae bacterium SP9]